MFFNLLKYNLKFIYKQALIFMIIVFVCAIISRLTAFDNPPFIILVINKFTNGAAFGFSLGLLINVTMRTWARFVTNIYGDESYLTHTLPVSPHLLWAAIFTAGTIAILTSILTLVIAVFIMYFSPEIIDAIRQLFYETFGTNVNLATLIIVFLIGASFQFIFALQAGLCGLLLGYRSHNHRLLRSVIYGATIYIFGAIVLYLLAVIWSCLDEGISQFLFESVYPELSVVFRALIGVSSIYLVYIAGIYLINSQLLASGVDVE